MMRKTRTTTTTTTTSSSPDGWCPPRACGGHLGAAVAGRTADTCRTNQHQVGSGTPYAAVYSQSSVPQCVRCRAGTRYPVGAARHEVLHVAAFSNAAAIGDADGGWHVIDVGVHYPVEGKQDRCVCGAERHDRSAVMTHVLEQGRKALASASPDELSGLLDTVLKHRSLAPLDRAADAVTRALQRHGGFVEIIRAALWLHWHPDGSLNPGVGIPNLTRRAMVSTVSHADRNFISFLRAMISSPYMDSPVEDARVDLGLVAYGTRAADRRLLADAVDDWLLDDPPADSPYADAYHLSSTPTLADISGGASIHLAALANTPWAYRQEAARLLRDQLTQLVTPAATLEQARQRATVMASPTSSRPAPHLTAAVEMLAVTTYAITLDQYRAVDQISPTEILRWLAEPGLPDLLDRTLAGTPAADWRVCVAGLPGGRHLVEAARAQAAGLVQAEITAVEQQVQPGDAVLTKMLGAGPASDVYWPATIAGPPQWLSAGIQPSIIYPVRIPDRWGDRHESATPDMILRDYDPADTRGAGTRYNAVRCAVADLRRAAYLAANPDLPPGQAVADLGERFLRYQPQPDIFAIMVTVVVDLLSVKVRRLPDMPSGGSSEDLLDFLKPLIAKAHEPYDPQERARATAYLTNAAGDAEALLSSLL